MVAAWMEPSNGATRDVPGLETGAGTNRRLIERQSQTAGHGSAAAGGQNPTGIRSMYCIVVLVVTFRPVSVRMHLMS